MKIGVQLHPQATSLNDLRAAWRAADAMGVTLTIQIRAAALTCRSTEIVGRATLVTVMLSAIAR